MAERDQEFLELMIKALADHPEDVKVTRTVDEMGVLLSLDVHAEDMGKIIGRSGNTAKAIRTLLRVVGMKNNARVNLKINEPAGSTHVPGGSHTPSSYQSTPAPSATMKSVDEAMADLKL